MKFLWSMWLTEQATGMQIVSCIFFFLLLCQKFIQDAKGSYWTLRISTQFFFSILKTKQPSQTTSPQLPILENCSLKRASPFLLSMCSYIQLSTRYVFFSLFVPHLYFWSTLADVVVYVIMPELASTLFPWPVILFDRVLETFLPVLWVTTRMRIVK